jgi:DNA-binding response OmpR family regulator
MAKKVLLVDDERDLLELLTINLERDGYSVDTASTASEALNRIAENRPDIILLDVMLPDMSGTKLANQLKNSPDTSSIPIILLTARDSETDIVVGLSMGADDYVTKPCSRAVISARIEAVLRRFTPAAKVNNDSLTAGPLKIIVSKHQVLVDSNPVELTIAEFKILTALVKAKGAVLSREQLMKEFASDPSVTERTIDVHIASLRKKLGNAREMLKTVHRLGYRFEV